MLFKNNLIRNNTIKLYSIIFFIFISHQTKCQTKNNEVSLGVNFGYETLRLLYTPSDVSRSNLEYNTSISPCLVLKRRIGNSSKRIFLYTGYSFFITKGIFENTEGGVSRTFKTKINSFSIYTGLNLFSMYIGKTYFEFSPIIGMEIIRRKEIFENNGEERALSKIAFSYGLELIIRRGKYFVPTFRYMNIDSHHFLTAGIMCKILKF